MQSLTRVAPCARAVVSHSLRRNISASSVAMASKQQDSIQKLYVDKIREYTKLSASGKVQMDPENQKDLQAESQKLEKMYGGGDLTKFPEFQFKEIDFETKQEA